MLTNYPTKTIYSNYTITVSEIIKNDVNIFAFDYYPYLRAGESIEDRKKELENKFINYYGNYEIGFETVERFQSFFTEKWQRKIDEYNTKWALYDTQNIFDTTTEATELDTANRNYDTAVNAYDLDENAISSAQKSSGKTKSESGLKVDNINKILSKYKNLDNNFIREFGNLFLKIF